MDDLPNDDIKNKIIKIRKLNNNFQEKKFKDYEYYIEKPI